MNFFFKKYLPFQKNGYNNFFNDIVSKKIFSFELEDFKFKKGKFLMKKKTKINYMNYKKNVYPFNLSWFDKFELLLKSLRSFPLKNGKNNIKIKEEKRKKIQIIKFAKCWISEFDKFSLDQRLEFLIPLCFFGLDEDKEVKKKSKRIFTKIINLHGISYIFSIFQKDLGNTDEVIRTIIVKLFCFSIVTLQFSNYFPFFRAFFFKYGTWITRYSIGQILQILLHNLSHLSKLEFTEVLKITEFLLKEKKKKLRGIGAGILSTLFKNFSGPRLRAVTSFIFPIFNHFKKEKKTNLAIFVKAGSLFVELFHSKKIFFFIKELFEISIKNLPTKKIFIEKIFLKTIIICLKKVGVSNPVMKKKVSDFLKFSLSKNQLFHLKTNLFLYSKIFRWFMLNGKISLSSWIFEKNLRIKQSVETTIALDLIRMSFNKKILLTVHSGIFTNLLKNLNYLIRESNEKELSNHNKLLMKSIHKTLICFIKYPVLLPKCSLSKIAGFLKWEIKNPKIFIRKCALKMLKKISPVFKKYKERILLGHLGIILFNNLEENQPNLLADVIYCLGSILRIFPPEYCIPPLNKIAHDILSLIEKKKITIEKPLFKIFSTFTKKGLIFFTQREQIRLMAILFRALKKGKCSFKKLSIFWLSYIASKTDPLKLVQMLLNDCQDNKKFIVSLSVTLSFLAINIGPQLIFPILFFKLNSLKIGKSFPFFLIFLCLFETLPPLSFFLYIKPLFFMLEKTLKEFNSQVHPILFILIGKICKIGQKLAFFKSSLNLFFFLLKNSKMIRKKSWKFLRFFLRNLFLNHGFYEIVPFFIKKFFCFHEKKKRKFLEFFCLINVNFPPLFMEYKLISGSDRFRSGEDFD